MEGVCLIRQQFFLDDIEILRLYHNGFTDFPTERKLEKRKEITGGVIKLNESLVDDFKNEEIHYDAIVSGFLPVDHFKNPYNRLSTHYKEFITYKTDVIDKDKVKDIAQFLQIAEFVQQWSSYDLKNFPFSLYNTILFSPTDVYVSFLSDKDNEQTLKIDLSYKTDETLMCIAKFKYNENIIETRVMDIAKGITRIEPENNWQTVDLEIYTSEQLLYAYYDLSFIESIQLNMSLITKRVDMDLKHANKTITLEQISPHKTVIGESTTSGETSTHNYQEL